MSRNKANDKHSMITKLEKMPIVEIACKQIGLSRATYYRWLKDDEEFAVSCDEAIEQSSAMINDMAESQLIQAIKDKNMSAITFWLKHHHRTYRAKLEVETNVHEQQILTPEQTELITQALRLAGMTISEDNDNE